ncbi:restriction endonuclease subunit S [Campylobacter sp. CLAX-22107-21]|uniref:restriction endonuclease subunit S n=1 Tax=Campylobacter devanensis TaxID=3161138 RepID=UPI002EB4EDA8|nr:restriction endonuclease subunit S [Campylobacter sp. CLAX-22107-21]
MMNKIPKGWEVKKLGGICEITMGQSPKGENVFENSQSLNGLEFHQGKIYFTDKFISKSKFITSDIRKIAEVGSILLCVRAPVGVINLTKRKIAIGRGLCALKANNQNNNFLYYYLLGLKQYFESKATGSTFSAITLNVVKNCEIPLPPLSEQKAIADKLDDSFAKIENAMTNLINAKENLKLYKQSVLKSAFNGDLLPSTSPTHWEVKKLGEICEITMGQSPKGENVFENSQSLNGLEFHQGKICFTDKFISKSKFITSDIRKIAEVGSILLCVRAPVGVINLTKRKIAIGRGLCALKANNQNNNFLYYYLLGLKQYFESKATGSTFSAITLNVVKNCEIPLPPLSEQNLIVTEIDRRFAIVDKTLNLIDKSIQNAKNLKQSILKKAFSGELRSEI